MKLKDLVNKDPNEWSASELEQFLDQIGMDKEIWDKFLALPLELKQMVYDHIDFLVDAQCRLKEKEGAQSGPQD